jgi:hypothetical protein
MGAVLTPACPIKFDNAMSGRENVENFYRTWAVECLLGKASRKSVGGDRVLREDLV